MKHLPRARHGLAVCAAIVLGRAGFVHAEPSPRGVEAPTAASREVTSVPALGNTARAREHYTKALGFYDAGAHAAALTEFRRAYALKPSYELLFNIGQLELLLQDHAAARRSLQRYLNEGASRVPRGRRADVLQQLEELAGKTTLAGGAAQLEERGPVQLPPEVSREPAANAVAPLPRVRPPSTDTAATLAWVSTGTLGLGALGTGIATLLTSRRYEQLRGTPAAPADAARARDELDRQRALVSDLATVTDVLAIATLASAGLSLYFTLRQGPANEAAPDVSLELTPVGLRATGSF